MFGYITGGKYIRMRSLQQVIYHYSLIHVQAGRTSQITV